jgi:hypothetical protein
MRPLIIILSLILLTSCFTTLSQRMDGWKRKSETEIVKSWGVPTKTYTLPDGSKALEYFYGGGGEIYQPPPLPGYETQRNPWPTRVTTYYCKVTFFLNNYGFVTNWRTEGNNCE